MYVTPNAKSAANDSKPFNERNKLYFMHFLFSFVSRVCDMSFILFMSSITSDTLFLVATIGFLSSLFVFLFLPLIGIAMDTFKRQIVVRWALAVKVLSISGAFCCFIYVSTTRSSEVRVSKSALFAIPVLAAVNGLSSAAISQSMERDWVVVLSNGDSGWLSVTNSVMRQIDLFCLTFANPLTGALFGLLPSSFIAVLLFVSNVSVCAALYWFLRYLYKTFPLLSVRESREAYYSSPLKQRRNQQVFTPLPPATTPAAAADCDVSIVTHEDTELNHLTTPAATVTTAVVATVSTFAWSIFGDFVTSGCAGAMLSSSLLYATCLNFGSLMIVYLQWSGVSGEVIRVCRGGAAAVGLLGALCFPVVNQWLGLYSTAQLAISVQALLSFVSALIFYFFSSSAESPLVLICLVLNAKSWIFDLSVRQIAQETIHESIRGRVNGQWRALMALSELTGFSLGLLLPSPDQFYLLASTSAGVVLFSFVLFTLSNPYGPLNLLKWDIPSIPQTEGRQTASPSLSYVRLVDRESDCVEGRGREGEGHYYQTGAAGSPDLYIVRQ